MTPRQRVLAALNHQQPDKVPIDFSAHRSSGISAIAYAKLRRHLKLPDRPIRVYDMIQQLAIVDPDVLDRFGIDTVEMGRGFLTEDKDWKDWDLPDGTPCQIPFYVNVRRDGPHWLICSDSGIPLGIQKKGCLYFEQIHFPRMDRPFAEDDFADLESTLGLTQWSVAHPGAHLPLSADGLAEMARCAKRLRESTDRAIVGLFGGNMFEMPQMLYRMDNYLMYMGLYPEATLRLSEALCKIYLTKLEKWLGAVGPYIDVILFGDDLGCQTGPLLSPEMYRRYYKPYHKRMWKRAKELAAVKVMLHCCGGIYELLDDLIDAGLDTFNPVQISCGRMDAATLKSHFGSRISFWGGGCDTQTILPEATPDRIAEHVRKQVGIFNPGGGFIFQQVHNIQADVPPQNVVAMFDAIRPQTQ
jgi:uroporphyrinogen decarboxylase